MDGRGARSNGKDGGTCAADIFRGEYSETAKHAKCMSLSQKNKPQTKTNMMNLQEKFIKVQSKNKFMMDPRRGYLVPTWETT